jgi:hypothetical protein
MEYRSRARGGRDWLFSVPITALLSAVLAALTAMIMFKLGGPQRQLKAGLGVVALVVVVVAALRPKLALALVLALLPFEFHLNGLGTDEVLIFGVGAVLAWRIKARRVPVWVFLGGTALVAGSLLSVLGAQDSGSALWGAVRWLGVLIVLAEAFSLLHDQPNAGRLMVDIVTTTGVIVVFFGLLQKAGTYVIIGAPYQAGNIQSFFSYYTNYGGFVGLATVLATGELLAAGVAHDRRRTTLYGAGVVFLLLGVSISASRGALLSLAAGWAILVVLTLRRGSLLLRALALLVVLAAAGYAATPSQTRSRILSRFSAPLGSQTEDQQRFALQRIGLTALEHKPLGIGYNNFRFYLANHPTAGVSQILAHSHRLPVQIGLDAGWLGLAGFLLLFVGAVGAAIRAGPWRGIRNIACAAALGGFMAQGLFDYLFFDISLVAYFLAMVWGAAHSDSPARSPSMLS